MDRGSPLDRMGQSASLVIMIAKAIVGPLFPLFPCLPPNGLTRHHTVN